MERYVRLRAVVDGGYTGYEAILVDGQEDENSDQTFEDVIDVWDYGIVDAGLVARSRAIEWAESLGVPYRD